MLSERASWARDVGTINALNNGNNKLKKPNYDNEALQRIEHESDFRSQFEPKDSPEQMSFEIQKALDYIISQCHPVDWSEDNLSIELIRMVREIMSGYKLPGVADEPLADKFDLEAYKITGKAEESHGDIAVVVTRMHNGHPFSGVAFYEAKASDTAGVKYPSFDTNQLRRLVTHTPRLSYLIYNKEPRNVGSSNWPTSIVDERNFDKHGCINKSVKRAHGVVIDANFLKNCRSIDFATKAVGQTFGHHFVHRVLSGRDLDYSRTVEATIRHWLKYTKRSPPLIVTVSIRETARDNFKKQPLLEGLEKVVLPTPKQALTNQT